MMMRTFNDKSAFLEEISRRKQEIMTVSPSIQKIVDETRLRGDSALRKFTRMYDGVEVEQLRVDEERLEAAEQNLDSQLREDIVKASENIRRFHRKQLPDGYTIQQEDGTVVEQCYRSLRRAGIYVPGGRYPLFSTVLMNVIPAQIAQVPEIIICTPPSQDGWPDRVILGTCSLLGIDKVYRVGGAQAISALAFGTESIPAVDKIAGPGNRYVSAAKSAVAGVTGIDMVAGPTELVIIADGTARPDLVAIDLLSQAEHDPLAFPVLLTTDPSSVKKIFRSIQKLTEQLKTAPTAREALRNRGMVYTGDDLTTCVEIANFIAAEHLSLHVENPLEWTDRIVAGAIFIGQETPVAWGDYWAGSNHTLPTNGQAHFRGPLSVMDFIVPYSVIRGGTSALDKSGDRVMRMALTEGLEAHSLSVKLRNSNESE